MARENWFFGLPIEGSFLLDVGAPPSGFRRYHPDDLHVTLAFLGPCQPAAAESALNELDARLLQVAASPIAIRLARVVPMGARRQYSALSALLDVGREASEALIAALRDSLADAARVPREQRAPKAHVTIARPSRRATFAERREGLLWAESLDLSSVHRTIDRIALYRWSEDRRDRLFRVVAERRLV